jgi:hypothetical protein
VSRKVDLPNVPDLVSAAVYVNDDDDTKTIVVEVNARVVTRVSGHAVTTARCDLLDAEAQRSASELRDYLRKHLLEWLQ